MKKRIITTMCPRDGYDTCFLNAIVGEAENGVSLKDDITHPMTRGPRKGFMCPRGAKDVKRVFVNNGAIFTAKW